MSRVVPQGDPFEFQLVYGLRSIAASRTGDVHAAEENYKALKNAMSKRADEDTRLEDYRRQEVEAWLAFAKRDGKKALKLMRSAANTQDQEDNGEFTVPAREMLADMLLELLFHTKHKVLPLPLAPH